LALELKRPTVLCNDTDQIFWNAFGNLLIDLKAHADFHADQPTDVLNDFLSTLLGVAGNTSGV
jgi:hypothetical protein